MFAVGASYCDACWVLVDGLNEEGECSGFCIFDGVELFDEFWLADEFGPGLFGWWGFRHFSLVLWFWLGVLAGCRFSGLVVRFAFDIPGRGGRAGSNGE